MTGEHPNGWSPGQIKEFLQTLLEERDRAIEQADSERNKAAANLRIELSRSREEGDDRLREHITNQVQQISAALISSEKLEIERLSRANAVIDALAEKLEVLRQAQQLAQGKFETSVESRFAQVNEFRGSLDDLGKQMATRREMETAVENLGATIEKARQERQHQIDDLRETMLELRSRIDVGPEALSSLKTRADLQAGRQAGIGLSANVTAALITVALTVVGLVTAIYLGTH